MEQFNLAQVVVLLSQSILVSGVLLLLFRLRMVLGIGLLFAALGVFQYMQVFLANTLYVEVYPGLVVSPGSSVLFSASLFMVLLIYIREDAKVLRTLIYALVAANLVLSILQYTFGYNVDSASVFNPYGLSSGLFVVNARVLLIGTLLLFVDSVLIILLYEAISKINSSFFFRIFSTMSLVLILDSIIFSFGGFAGTEQFKEILVSGIVSKVAVAFVYTIIFTIYLYYFEKVQPKEAGSSFTDIFYLLTYRQKFEKVSIEKENQELKAQKTLKKFEQLFESVVQNQTEVIIRWKTDGTVSFVNDAFCQYFGHSREALIGQSFFPFTSAKNLKTIKDFLNSCSPERPYFDWTEEGISHQQKPYWIKWKERGFYDEEGNLIEIQSVGRDITEQRLAQLALEESEVKYKALFEQGGDAVYLADLNGSILEANAVATKQLGYSKEEFMQKNLMELHTPSVPIEKAKLFWSRIQSREPIQHEGAHRRKDGSILPVEITTSKIEVFQTEYILGFVRDISTRVEAQKKQSELSERYKLILQTTLDSFILADTQGNIVDVNNAYCQTTGYSRAELLAMNMVQLEGRLSPEEVREKIGAMIAAGGARFETAHKRKDGQLVEMDVSISIMNQGEEKLVAVFCRDITDQKIAEKALAESEDRFRTLYNFSPDMFLSISPNDGNIRLCNLTFLEKTGYSREEIIGRSVINIYHEDTIGQAKEAFKQFIRTGSIRNIELILKTKDGKKIDVNLNADAIRDSKGNILYSMSSLRDITEQKRKDQALRKSKERLSKAEQIANVGNWSLELETGKVEWSEELYRIYGRKPEEVTLTLDNLRLWAHPEDSASNEEYFRQMLEISPGKVLQPLEYRLIRPNGEVRWVESIFETKFNKRGKAERFMGVILDITNRKQADLALKKSEAFLQNAIDSVQDGVSVLDMDGKHVRVNPALCEMTGFTKEELIGTGPPHPYWPEEEMQNIQHAFEKTNAGFKDDHELVFKRKNGVRFPVIISPSPIKDADGNITNFIATVKDISERKKAELKLKESENRFRSIFEQAAVGVALVDSKSGKFIRVNQRYLDILGYTQEEMLTLDFQSITHPDDLERDLGYQARFLNGDLKKLSLEKRYISKRGATVWTHVTISPIWDKGKSSSYHIAVIQDITGTKKLNDWKNLNALVLEQTTKGFPLKEILSDIIKGIDGLIPQAISSIMLVNEKNQLVSAANNRLPSSWIEAIDPLDIGPDVGSCGTAVYTGKRVVSSDISTDSRWEGYHEIALSNSLRACWSEPIISTDNKTALGTFGVYFTEPRHPSDYELKLIESVSHLLSLILEKAKSERELTNYKDHLEELVSLRTRELEEANQELESFSYSVSHDLRAPLTRLDGFSKVLQNNYADKLDEKGLHYLSRIRAASQNMAVLIDDILLLSKIGRQVLKKEPVDLGQLSTEIIDRLRESDPNRKLNLKVNPNLKADMDPGLAKLMLENLLQNAWKFTRKEEVSIIEVSKIEKDGKVWFSVKDNGMGFEMKYYDQLFKPFQRLHSSAEMEGTGIGMATVKRIINKHSGQIEAEGQPGKGAVFYFKL